MHSWLKQNRSKIGQIFLKSTIFSLIKIFDTVIKIKKGDLWSFLLQRLACGGIFLLSYAGGDASGEEGGSEGYGPSRNF